MSIKIIKYKDILVALFDNENNYIGELKNIHELNDIRIQIAEQQLTGYYIIYDDAKIELLPTGDLSDFPRGMYDEQQRDLATITRLKMKNNNFKNLIN